MLNDYQQLYILYIYLYIYMCILSNRKTQQAENGIINIYEFKYFLKIKTGNLNK